MNILYFAPIKLWPDGHGNIATVHQYIQRMRNLGHKVHYIFFDLENMKDFDIFYAQKFVDTLDVIKQTPRGNMRNENGYYFFDSFYQDGLGEKIRELCTVYNIDVVICTYIMHSKILEYVPDNILKIIDTHDKMTDRHISLIKNNIKDEFFSCTKEDEARYLSRADIIWARRDEEADFFNEILGENKAITVSHFNSPNYLNKTTQRLKKVGFLASDNNVNAKMVQDFISAYSRNEKILNTDLEVIIGGNVYKILERENGYMDSLKGKPIKFIGKVNNIVDFYKEIDAVVVPIMFGTGINVKMIEAMSFGLPIISTTCGIKGCDQTNSPYHTAKSLEELIEKIYDLYKNPKDIAGLTKLSKELFEQFYNQNARCFDECFTSETKTRKATSFMLDHTKCSGCGICAGLCDRQALKMIENEKGFYRPIKQSNCINCNLCNKICSLKHCAKSPNTLKKDVVFGNYNNIYAVHTNDTDLKKEASTGGFIRSFLINNLDKFDGVIALCETEEALKPEMKLLKDSQELLKSIAKSKYFSIEASKAAEILKNNEGNYLIVGLPCQIATLKNAFSILKATFFSIELFCGGLFSLRFLRNYIEFKGMSSDSKIDFKNKRNGWHNISLTLTDASGSVSTPVDNDEFYFAQRNKIFTQNACLECNYCCAGTADIQVGDFWGSLYQNDNDGVNLIITRSEKADELIKSCAGLTIEKKHIQDVYKSQPWFVESYRRNVLKSEVLSDIQSIKSKKAINKQSFRYINNISSIKENYQKDINDLKENYKQINKKDNFSDNRSFLILPSDIGFGSFGDQAMILSLINKIKEKYPNANIAILNLYSSIEDGFLLNNGIDIKVYNINTDLEKTLTEIKDKYTDLLVIGADILDGGYGIQHSLKYFEAMEIANRHNKRVQIEGFSFNKTKQKQIINTINKVSTFATLCVRDLISYKRLQEHGCKNLIQVTDMSFLLNISSYKKSNYAEALYKKLEKIKKTGIDIIGLHLTSKTNKDANAFIDKISESLKEYKNAQIVILPHDIRILQTKLSDYNMGLLINQKLTEAGYNCINAYDLDNIIDVKYIVSLLDLLISSRMHIVISALSSNVPALSFVYQDKFEGLYSLYNFKNKTMFNSDSFSPKDLAENIKYILTHRKQTKNMLEKRNVNVFKLSKKNFEF